MAVILSWTAPSNHHLTTYHVYDKQDIVFTKNMWRHGDKRLLNGAFRASTATSKRRLDPVMVPSRRQQLIRQQLLQQQQQRTYMDVHQRPSHSGMFKRDGVGGTGSGSSSKFPPPPPPHSFVPPKAAETHPHDDSALSHFSLYALLFWRAALSAGIIYGFTEYVCDITLCEGPSMSPTLHPLGEIVLIDKWTLRRQGVADGCNILERTRAAVERQEAFVKQRQQQKLQTQQKSKGKGQNNVAAAASRQDDDEEEFWHEKRISVSDLERPTWKDWYQMLSTPLSVGDVIVMDHPSRRGTVCKRVAGLPGDTVLRPHSGLLVVPDGHAWLEGDNPVNSADSRTYGVVPLSLIQGRVLFRVWPLRGSALLQRGAPPRQQVTGFTILPAGYEGQHIIKHRHDVDKINQPQKQINNYSKKNDGA